MDIFSNYIQLITVDEKDSSWMNESINWGQRLG